jgi:hypothetical protein
VTRRTLATGALALILAAGAAFAWRDGPAGEPVEAAPAAAAVGGVTLFQAKGCAWCHRTATNEPFVEGMPDLTGIAEWGGTRRPGLDAAAYLAESVREPSAFESPVWHADGRPTSGMPSLVVSDAELAAITDHLLG